MFGIGLPEMIVIMAVALIVVGPDKLPELARSLAKGIGELKKTMNQVKENLSEETKAITSVQEDLQKTAGKLTENLLNDETRTWPPEDDASQHTDAIEEADTIDLQPLEERPWERDAQQDSPLEDSLAQDDTDASPSTAPEPVEDTADDTAKSSPKDTPPSSAA